MVDQLSRLIEGNYYIQALSNVEAVCSNAVSRSLALSSIFGLALKSSAQPTQLFYTVVIWPLFDVSFDDDRNDDGDADVFFDDSAASFFGFGCKIGGGGVARSPKPRFCGLGGKAGLAAAAIAGDFRGDILMQDVAAPPQGLRFVAQQILEALGPKFDDGDRSTILRIYELQQRHVFYGQCKATPTDQWSCTFTFVKWQKKKI
uniref:Uncharacterized protein n=1 Tax=Romanomermis culicivorax TaxID=13658 RepID=A0A915IRB8_ROMCU